MKKIIFLLLLAPVYCTAQQYTQYGDFKYCGDTLIFRGTKIQPGDSVRLGFGSGANKNFIFVFQQTSNMKKRLMGIENPLPQMASMYLILKRIDKVKVRGFNIVEPIFGRNIPKERLEWSLQFTNAVDSKEIILPSQLHGTFS